MYNAYVLTNSQSVIIAQQKFDDAHTAGETFYETCIMMTMFTPERHLLTP